MAASVPLPAESPWSEELQAGYSPWGCKRSQSVTEMTQCAHTRAIADSDSRKLRVFNLVIRSFKSCAPFIVIIKYRLGSLCCTMETLFLDAICLSHRITVSGFIISGRKGFWLANARFTCACKVRNARPGAGLVHRKVTSWGRVSCS